jgi:pSer/pThr/pTyr-binding forkhead associated (FHA) protein
MAENCTKCIWLKDAQGKLLELRVGRSARLGRAIDNDIVLEDTTVSKRHAVISFDNGRAFLRDLGSSNGTFIEGVRVTGGELTNGSVVKLGRVPLVYREDVGVYSSAPPVSAPRGQVRTATADSTASSQRSFFSATAVAIFGALFLLSLVATLAGRALLSSSSSTVGHSSFGNLVDSQGYRLPNATSDFIGDWCGWVHVVSCEPAGSCDEEPIPESISFKSDSGGVVMHYTIEAGSDLEVRDIEVRALDPHQVHVTYVAKHTDAAGAEQLIDIREDIVSVNADTVRSTSYSAVDGIPADSEEDNADMTKCTDEFLASQQKYVEEKSWVSKGEVNGQIPAK